MLRRISATESAFVLQAATEWLVVFFSFLNFKTLKIAIPEQFEFYVVV